MLTGKCKKEFDEWLKGKYNFLDTYKETIGGLQTSKDFITNTHEIFKRFPFSMQYGIYQDFFDSVNLNIMIESNYDYLNNYKREPFYRIIINGTAYGYDTESGRNRTRVKAITKANEIYNDE